MKNKKVSVVLPVYNGERDVHESIQSILNQTYQNFEFIIINDGSIDNSGKIIGGFKDSRIVYLEQDNQGLAAALNNAIKVSTGEYIARQDQDDYSYPERFEKQIEFLESHSDYAVVGTWALEIDTEAKKKWNMRNYYKQHAVESFALKYTLLFDSPFVHSSVMIRKSVFDKVGLYCTDKDRQPPEDYELWSRIGRKFEIANIPEILHVYRRGPESMTRHADGSINTYIDRCTKISIENICYVLGRKDPNRIILDLAALVNTGYFRVNSMPSFSGIANMLYELAEKLSGGISSRHAVLREVAHRTLMSVKRNYFVHRYGKIAGRLRLILNRTVSEVR